MSNTFFIEMPLESKKHGTHILKMDLPDFERAYKYSKWCIKSSKGGKLYVQSTRKPHVLLHRFIMEPNVNETIDHINNNGFDNTRVNLRKCSQRNNNINRAPDKRNKLGLKGVTYYPYKQRLTPYYARIKHNGKQITIGHYATPQEAALAYNKAATQYHGEYAWLNPIAVKSAKESQL